MIILLEAPMTITQKIILVPAAFFAGLGIYLGIKHWVFKK